MEFRELMSNEDEGKDYRFDDIEQQSRLSVRARSSSQTKQQRLVSFSSSAHRSSGSQLHENDEEKQVKRETFVKSTGLTSEEAKRRLQHYGPNELADDSTSKWYILASQFWKPMAIMIWIAIIVQASIQQFTDLIVLLAILFINSFIAFHETVKAGDAVAALKQTLIPTCTVKRDDKFITMNATEIVPGDLILLGSGSTVPADCRVNDGQIQVDEAALTGESLPVTKYKGGSCKMGSHVVGGEVQATVDATGSETFVGRTAVLLSNKEELSNFQKLLVRVVIILFTAAGVLCAVVFIYLLALTNVEEALAFTVVLLVASIPLAIEIVTTTTLALGSRELAKEGAIVTRLSAIEDMAGMSILCSDKTGTLTMNKMVIQEETPIYKKGESQYTLLRYAAMAAKWWEPPRDALDTLTLNSVDMPSMSAVEQQAYMPFDPVVKRTEGTVRVLETGEIFRTTKGAPLIVLKLIEDQEQQKQRHSTGTNQGSSMKPIKTPVSELRAAVEKDLYLFGTRGIRSLAVAKTNAEDEWEFLGLLTFLDPPRPDTKQTIEDAMDYSVTVKMITGDRVLIARETARVLGMGNYIKDSSDLPLLDSKTKQKPENLSRDYGDMCLACDGFAQVFPEHKYLIVECLRELGYKVGMTGDGVNDAPALKRADVGVAVQGATDAARAAADIVLTQPGLSTIVHGIITARRIFVRIRSFLIYRFSCSLQLLLFFFIAVLALPPVNFMPNNWENNADFPDNKEWPDYFSIPVLMLMLITLLNDGTIIAIGYDNAQPRMQPEKWNLPVLILVGFTMAAIATLSSLLLLYLSLTSWEHGHVYQTFGIGGLSYGQITTSIYLQLSVSQFLTIFCARTGAGWFWSSQPSWVLLLAPCVALTASTVLAVTWPESEPNNIPTLGLGYRRPYALPVYIWLYCIVWWVIQDAVKVGLYAVLIKYNVFGYNDTGKLVLPESARQYMRDHKEEDLEMD